MSEEMKWIKVADLLPITDDVFLIWPKDKYAGYVVWFWPYESHCSHEKNTFYIESIHGEVSVIQGVTHWCKIIGPSS